MYTDDATIYFNLKDIPAYNREIAINKELDKVNVWLKLNKLTLNVEKRRCIFFRKKTHSRQQILNKTTKALMLFLTLILRVFN